MFEWGCMFALYLLIVLILMIVSLYGLYGGIVKRRELVMFSRGIEL